MLYYPILSYYYTIYHTILYYTILYYTILYCSGVGGVLLPTLVEMTANQLPARASLYYKCLNSAGTCILSYSRCYLLVSVILGLSDSAGIIIIIINNIIIIISSSSSRPAAADGARPRRGPRRPARSPALWYSTV